MLCFVNVTFLDITNISIILNNWATSHFFFLKGDDFTKAVQVPV